MTSALLNIPQATLEIWGEVNNTTLYRTRRMLKEGTLEHIRVGNRWFIPRATIKKWMGEK